MALPLKKRAVIVNNAAPHVCACCNQPACVTCSLCGLLTTDLADHVRRFCLAVERRPPAFWPYPPPLRPIQNLPALPQNPLITAPPPLPPPNFAAPPPLLSPPSFTAPSLQPTNTTPSLQPPSAFTAPPAPPPSPATPATSPVPPVRDDITPRTSTPAAVCQLCRKQFATVFQVREHIRRNCLRETLVGDRSRRRNIRCKRCGHRYATAMAAFAHLMADHKCTNYGSFANELTMAEPNENAPPALV